MNELEAKTVFWGGVVAAGIGHIASLDQKLGTQWWIAVPIVMMALGLWALWQIHANFAKGPGRPPLVEWKIRTAEGINVIWAANALSTQNGDLVLTNRNGGLLKAYAKGHWIGCDMANPPVQRKGG